MGYSIELYGLDWQKLGRVFGSGDRELYEAVVQKEGPRLSVASDAELKAAWERALGELLLGDLGRELAALGADAKARAPQEASDATALAVAAVIRNQGEPIGDLRHSSVSGQYFRETFLAHDAPRALNTSVDLLLLVSRPLFGLTHSGFPSWGGLRQSEVRAALGGHTLRRWRAGGRKTSARTRAFRCGRLVSSV